MSATASDQELIDALGAAQDGRRVLSLSRRPYLYATSAPLEEVLVRTDDGEEEALILKDLSRERLLGDAREAKPDFLYEPRREIETYRRVLAGTGIGPQCVAAVADSDPPRNWILIERVPGVELWQVGELEVWEEVARWLAGFHGRFSEDLDSLRAANPYLLEHSEAWFRSWAERAATALARSGDGRASELGAALAGYDEVVGSLTALPRTLVHGELYPSNVLVDRGTKPPRVVPVDWEMAAIGPSLIDLAALVSGWNGPERRRLADAYRSGGREVDAPTSPRAAIDRQLAGCRLHLSLQWIGWAPEWRPPPEHARDWLGEALAAAEELGLG